MTRLEKNAWVELVTVGLSTLLAGGIFASFVESDTSGIEYIAIFVVIGTVLGVYALRAVQKYESKYDEREREIRRKAANISILGMTLLLMIMCIVPFFYIGGKGSIDVYYLPIIFWGCIFTGQVVQSSVILFQCAKEDADEQ